jgi:KDO2-lipid IV(A) lauroyltransferase
MANDRPSLSRRIAWRLEAAGFDLFTLLIRILPIDVASAGGAALFKALGPLTGAHRTAERGLRLAFPDMGETERRRLLAAQWDNFGRYIAEIPILDRLTSAGGRVEVVGAERLTAIAASNRPAVFVSGHFSNLEVMAAVIVAAGIPCEVTYRAANNPLVDARIKTNRMRYGVRLFAPKGADGARELLDALSKGRSVAMMNDQRYDAGVEGPFFGHPVRTNPAAARLALRFGALIQPMSIQRLRGARFRCVVHEPIAVKDTGARAADVEAGVAAINAFIEERVRERPGEWWWLHRRWPKEVYAGLERERPAR